MVLLIRVRNKYPAIWDAFFRDGLCEYASQDLYATGDEKHRTTNHKKVHADKTGASI